MSDSPVEDVNYLTRKPAREKKKRERKIRLKVAADVPGEMRGVGGGGERGMAERGRDQMGRGGTKPRRAGRKEEERVFLSL